MKKILTVAVFCAAMIGFTSCNDFLGEEPKSSITDVAYYKTADQIIANTNYLYRTGAPSFLSNMTGAYRGSSVSASEMLTGYFSNDFGGQEVDFDYANKLTRQNNTHAVCSKQSNDVWTTGYRVINIANSIIKYIDNVDMEAKDQYRAEAKFFRALNYFYLVKMFGDVPMVTNPYEGVIEYPERTAKATIYENVIIPDLKEASEVLSANSFPGNGHRITKYVAEMVLADVYMMLGNYAEASVVLQDVVKNSGASLTTNDDLGLNSAFNKLRTTDDLSEVIYSFEYDATISSNGNLPTHAFNGDAEKLFDTYSLWVNVFNVSNKFLNVYEASDLRIQPNQFFHWEYTNPVTGESMKFEEDGKSVACNWYWYDEKAVLETAVGTKDWNIYRYAEALLSAAEAIAQSQGVTSEAANYLAQIKARANMDGKTVNEISSDLQSLDKQSFIEECWKERMRELPLEMKMWDMCVRTGKFPVISQTEKGKVQFVNLIGATNGSGATFKETDLAWPIPVEEIQRNPNLTQNDGYARQ